MATTRGYAAKTDVPAAKTRAEIERLLLAHGATDYTLALREDHAKLAFRLSGLPVILTVPLPDPKDSKFTSYRQGYTTRSRTPDSAAALWEQACRARWRALLLVVRAKLEAIEVGILTEGEAFFADTQTDTGTTVYERYREDAYAHLAAGTVRALPDPTRKT